jgi:poly(beta-D-mannuronate) lyase
MERGLAALLLVLCAVAAAAAEHRVASAEDISRLDPQLRPGDILVMKDGPWLGQSIVLRAKGSAGRPIVLRADHPGKTVLAGKSSIAIEGEHIVVSGLSFEHGTATGDAVKVAGRNNRLTDTAIVGGSYKFFVHLFGTSNRVDHCYFAGKTNDSPTLQVEVEGAPNYHLLNENHFGPRPPLGRNGGETMRVGYSHQSMTNSRTLVERNLFQECDGELEIISNKSCENTYRWNTFTDCAGMLTLRHGNRCTVDGNFVIAHHKRGSGGIRVIGEDHTVINNYIDGVEQGGFWITSGIPDSELKGYFQARNCLIAFNTFVDSRGPAVDLDAGIGSSRRTLRPENITIANNIFSLSSGKVFKGREGAGYKWLGNLVSGGEEPEPREGVRVLAPPLERARDGFWRPTVGSSASDAAEGVIGQVRTDIDGQPRTGKPDMGCDEISNAPIKNKALTRRDVGPAWMRESQTERGGANTARIRQHSGKGEP